VAADVRGFSAETTPRGSDDPDFEYLIVDSTIVRTHQHAAGAKKGGLKITPSDARAAA
jgi:putative transposase